MGTTPYTEVEESYKNLISRHEEEDKRFGDDAANKRAELVTEKLEKHNELELQVKALNYKLIES